MQKIKKLKNAYFFTFLLVIILLLKIVIIPFTSAGFDMSTFFVQMKKMYDFNFNILDNWNKGCLLIFLYQLAYSSYVFVLKFFHLAKDNLILFIIFLKIPFFLMDLGIGVFIYKIILKIGNNKEKALFGLFLWLLNPLAWFWTEMGGIHEIFIVFFLIGSFYFLINRKTYLSIIFLSVAFSHKYAFLGLLPIYIFYIIFLKEDPNFFDFIIESIKYSIIFLFVYIVNIAPFFINWNTLSFSIVQLKMYLNGITSFVSESSYDNCMFKSSPVYIGKLIYLFIFKDVPNYCDKIYTDLGYKAFFFGVPLLFLGTYALQLVAFFKKKDNLKKEFQVLGYIILALSIFFLLVVKVEDQWLLWIFPFLIIFQSLTNAGNIISSLSLMLLIIFKLGQSTIWYFGNLNKDFGKFANNWNFIQFAESSITIISTAVIIYFIYNCVIFLKIYFKKKKNDFGSKICIVDPIILFGFLCFLLIFFLIPAINIYQNRSPENIPLNAVAYAETWNYRLKFNAELNRLEILWPADYFSYILKNYSKELDESMMLEISSDYQMQEKHTLEIASLPYYKYKYYKFSEIKKYLKIVEGKYILDLPNLQYGRIGFASKENYSAPFKFYFNETYYFLEKYKVQIYFNAALFFAIFLITIFFLCKEYRKILNYGCNLLIK